jgi:hypothetical protein
MEIWNEISSGFIMEEWQAALSSGISTALNPS